MFGVRLTSLRKKKGLTQVEISKILKVPRSTYSNYELGNREPDFDVIEKLAQLFDVSIDYLLGRTDDPSIHLSDDSKKIIDLLDLTEEELNEKMDFDLELDGQLLTKEEVLRFVAFVRAERQINSLK